MDLAGAEAELCFIKDRERVLKITLEKAGGALRFYYNRLVPPSPKLPTVNALAENRSHGGKQR